MSKESTVKLEINDRVVTECRCASITKMIGMLARWDDIYDLFEKSVKVYIEFDDLEMPTQVWERHNGWYCTKKIHKPLPENAERNNKEHLYGRKYA